MIINTNNQAQPDKKLNAKEILIERYTDLIKGMNDDIERMNTSSNSKDAQLMDFGISKKMDLKAQLETQIKNYDELEQFIMAIIERERNK